MGGDQGALGGELEGGAPYEDTDESNTDITQSEVSEDQGALGGELEGGAPSEDADESSTDSEDLSRLTLPQRSTRGQLPGRFNDYVFK